MSRARPEPWAWCEASIERLYTFLPWRMAYLTVLRYYLSSLDLDQEAERDRLLPAPYDVERDVCRLAKQRRQGRWNDSWAGPPPDLWLSPYFTTLTRAELVGAAQDPDHLLSLECRLEAHIPWTQHPDLLPMYGRLWDPQLYRSRPDEFRALVCWMVRTGPAIWSHEQLDEYRMNDEYLHSIGPDAKGYSVADAIMYMLHTCHERIGYRLGQRHHWTHRPLNPRHGPRRDLQPLEKPVARHLPIRELVQMVLDYVLPRRSDFWLTASDSGTFRLIRPDRVEFVDSVPGGDEREQIKVVQQLQWPGYHITTVTWWRRGSLTQPQVVRLKKEVSYLCSGQKWLPAWELVDRNTAVYWAEVGSQMVMVGSDDGSVYYSDSQTQQIVPAQEAEEEGMLLAVFWDVRHRMLACLQHDECLWRLVQLLQK